MEEVAMSHRVLIVDDETATVFGLKALVENDEIEVLTATSAQAAKKVLRDEQVDVVLSDIRLSGTLDAEGLDLLGFVKEKCPGVRVILMTGYGDATIMQQAFDMGASYYFEKPVELQVLSRAIRELGLHTAAA